MRVLTYFTAGLSVVTIGSSSSWTAILERMLHGREPGLSSPRVSSRGADLVRRACPEDTPAARNPHEFQSAARRLAHTKTSVHRVLIGVAGRYIMGVWG